MKGTVILGVPIGTNDFVNDEIGKELSNCDQQYKKLVHFPFADCFLLLTRYCANQVIPPDIIVSMVHAGLVDRGRKDTT